MIIEDYVSFETAKLLKERGFDEATIGYYYTLSEIPEKIKFFDSPISIYYSDGLIGCIQAPTLQMAMKWLREVHNIHIDTHLSFSEDPINYPPSYYVYILDSKSGNSIINPAARIDGLNPLTNANNVPRDFNTYEQACEAAIKYCLEKLI